MNFVYGLVTVGLPVTVATVPALTADMPEMLLVTLPVAVLFAAILQLPALAASAPLRTDKAD